MWKEIVLWLFVINLGIAFGAGLYEARVVIPEWGNIPLRAWPNTGLMFWAYVTTVPLTVLTIANRIVIVERVATFSYFIPTMVRLMSIEGLADGDVKAALSQWQLMNHGRHVLTLAGWLAALKAFSLLGRPYGIAGVASSRRLMQC